MSFISFKNSDKTFYALQVRNQRLAKEGEGEYRFNYNSPDSRSCALIHSYRLLALSERGIRRIQREPSWPVQKEHFSFLISPACAQLWILFLLCNLYVILFWGHFFHDLPLNIISYFQRDFTFLIYCMHSLLLSYSIIPPYLILFIEFIFSGFILFTHLFIDIIPASHPPADRKSKGPGPTWVVFSLTLPLIRTLLDTHKQMLNSNQLMNKKQEMNK